MDQLTVRKIQVYQAKSLRVAQDDSHRLPAQADRGNEARELRELIRSIHRIFLAVIRIGVDSPVRPPSPAPYHGDRS
jgi:hypothetical protein